MCVGFVFPKIGIIRESARFFLTGNVNARTSRAERKGAYTGKVLDRSQAATSEGRRGESSRYTRSL